MRSFCPIIVVMFTILVIPGGARCFAQSANRSPALSAQPKPIHLQPPAESELRRLLREKGVPYDTNRVNKAVIEGLAKAVDSRAKVMSPDEMRYSEEIRSVSYSEEWTEGLCYLKLTGMYKGGGEEILEKLGKWGDERKSGVVIDLRWAGGNDLDSVDMVAGFLAGTNELYRIANGYGKIFETHRGRRAAATNTVPWIVLMVDEQTCEGSELLVAILKGRPGITVLGDRTSGDTRIRELIKLDSGDFLKLGTKLAVPSGRAGYQAGGVKPDVPVTSRDEDRTVILPKQWHYRPQSEKARKDKELAERVSADTALKMATDILISIKALGWDEASSSTAGKVHKAQ